MIFVSLAQATSRLGIDGKTLQRWLVQAQMSVQPHPSDGRQKGLSLEQLHTLAQHHQRQLAPLSSPSSTSGDIPASPLVLLSEQLTALQQQMADLSRLLVPPPTSTSAPPPTRSSARRSRSASTVAPTAPRKLVHVIPRVEYAGDGRYVVICPKQGRLPLEPDTPEWFDWVRIQSSFRFVGKEGYFTAHHWWRVPRGA